MDRILVVVLLCLVSEVSGIFWFHVTSEKETCFTEEVGLEAATLHVRYNVKQAEGTQAHGNTELLGSMSEANSVRAFTISVRASHNQKQILSRRVGDLKGSVLAKIDDQTPQADVCFIADPLQHGALSAPIKIRTEIDHRHKAFQRDEAPKRKTVKGSGPGGMAIETFQDERGQVSEVLKTQEELAHMHRSLEDLRIIMGNLEEQATTFTKSQSRFLTTSESTNERVWVASFITIAIVVSTSFYQYRHLKGYLLKKKLV